MPGFRTFKAGSRTFECGLGKSVAIAMEGD